MDLFVLNPEYKRSKLVENWSSLVWTERYATNGDFELVSSNISEVLSLLPLGSPTDPPTLVAIGDSNVPMVVETHQIEKPKNGVPTIKTSGRSFETVLDRRTTVTTVTTNAPRSEVKFGATKVSDAIVHVVKSIIVDGKPTAADKITEINFLNSITETAGVEEQYVVEPKDLYSWVVEILAKGKFGMRSEINHGNKIAVILYEGKDKTKEVVFDVSLEQFDEASYILSHLGSKNVMVTATKNGMQFSTIGSPSGLARRVDFQDLSSEISIAVGADLTSLTKNRGNVALLDRLPIALFSGKIAEDIAHGYGSTYSLGDIVTLQGEYGLSQEARIAEFVRTHDATGEKSYPTFESTEGTVET